MRPTWDTESPCKPVGVTKATFDRAGAPHIGSDNNLELPTFSK